MKLHCYPEADSLYIELNPKLTADSRERIWLVSAAWRSSDLNQAHNGLHRQSWDLFWQPSLSPWPLPSSASC